MPIFVEFPTDNTDIYKLADWMELNTLIDSDGGTSRQELVAILSNGADETERDQIKDSPNDIISQDVMNELAQRRMETGSGYPFTLHGNLLKRKSDNDNHTAYKFCLLISYYNVTSKLLAWKQDKNTKMFERLCEHTLNNYLTIKYTKTTTRVFGWPRDDHTSFKVALDALVKDFGAANLIGRLAGNAKDAGLDIMGWNKFLDGLPGFLFLGQCATGNDWEEKAGDIKGIMPTHFTSDVSTMTGIFIPHLVPTATYKDIDKWRKLSVKSGTIFDRSRIAVLSKGWHPETVKGFIIQTIANIKLD